MADKPKLMTPEERVVANVTTSFGAAALMVKLDRADILAKAKMRAERYAIGVTGDGMVDVIPISELTNLIEGR